MTLLRRVLIIICLTGALMLAMGAASLLGPARLTTVAVIEIRGRRFNAGGLQYEVIDLTHGLSARQSLQRVASGALVSSVADLPDDGEAALSPYVYGLPNFAASPPLILGYDNGDSWAFARVDPLRETVTPFAFLTTPLPQNERPLHITMPDVPTAQLVPILDERNGDRPETRLLTAVGMASFHGALWSPDWSRVLLTAEDAAAVGAGDGSDLIAIQPMGDAPLSPYWSPDSRFLLFAAESPATMDVVDALTGRVSAALDGRAPSWCADRIVYSWQPDGRSIEIRLSSPDFATSEVLFAAGADVMPRLIATPVDPARCDRFVLGTGSNDFWLLDAASGALAPLGGDVGRVLAGSADELLYLAHPETGTEVWRLALGVPDAAAEVVAALPYVVRDFTLGADGRTGYFILDDSQTFGALDLTTSERTLMTRGAANFSLLTSGALFQ